MVDIYCCFIIKCILETVFGRYIWYLKLHGEGGRAGGVRLGDCSK